MAVDKEMRHWECTKCKDVFSQTEHYSAKNQKCLKGGTHSLKVVQASWNKSALGATVNLIGRGVKAGANKAAEYNSEEAREMREVKKQQEEELRKIREEEQKIKDKELADKTMKVYNIIKPYLKFIIPIYVLAFVITFFIVKEKNRLITGIFFGLPLVYVIYLTYNAFSNRER